MKAELQRYLQASRDALLFKLDGLPEYDVRRPMTPTGTNLLGLVKHLTFIEYVYFGDTFGRPYGRPWPWAAGEDQADMYAREDETREDIVGGYRAAWVHADATIDALDLDADGHVAHWDESDASTTLHHLLIHVIAETNRHAGHADIVRETIDGMVGLRSVGDNVGDREVGYVEKLEAIAVTYRG